jgi:hypothetical protein
MWIVLSRSAGIWAKVSRIGSPISRSVGREPRDFADYAREAAATGAWTPELGRAA